MEPNEIESLLFKTSQDPELFNKTLSLAIECANKELTVFDLDTAHPENKLTLLELIVQNATQENIIALLEIDRFKSRCIDPDYSDTLLHIAVKNNKIKIVELVCKNLVNPNLMNQQGETALTIAAHLGFDDIINFLLHHHANPNQEDANNNTPLLLATKAKHGESIKTLLFFGAGIGHKLPKSFLELSIDADYCCVLGMQIDDKTITIAEPGFECAIFDLNAIDSARNDPKFIEQLKNYDVTFDDYKKQLRNRCLEVLDRCEKETDKIQEITSFLKQLKFPTLVEMLEEVIIRHNLLPELEKIVQGYKKKNHYLNSTKDHSIEEPLTDTTIAKLNSIFESISKSPLLKTLERNKKINSLSNLVADAEKLKQLLDEASRSQGLIIKIVITVYLALLVGSVINLFTVFGIRMSYCVNVDQPTNSTGSQRTADCSQVPDNIELGLNTSIAIGVFFAFIIIAWSFYVVSQMGEVPYYMGSPLRLRLTTREHRTLWLDLIRKVQEEAEKYNLPDVLTLATHHNQNYHHINMLQQLLADLTDLLKKEILSAKREGPLWLRNSSYPRIGFWNKESENTQEINSAKECAVQILEFNI